MKNNEFNNSPSNELNSTKSFEFDKPSINDNIVNNSENSSNKNYDSNVSEYGENNNINNNSNGDNLGLDDFKASAQANAGQAARASTFSASTALSIATTALVAIVGGISVLTTTVTTKVDVKIESIVASYNYIDYDITATGDTSSLGLTITNGFDLYYVDLTEGSNVGKATNLKPNMDYTISITYNDFLTKKSAYTGVITTLSTNEYVTDINTFKLEYLCQCGVDGYFYFSMDFRDDFEYWYDFNVTLIDKEGHISKCELTDNLYDVQKIAIVNYDKAGNDLIGDEARLKVECSTKETNEKVVLYDKNVEI